jgi:glutaminyl-peptide cyclotransferase
MNARARTLIALGLAAALAVVTALWFSRTFASKPFDGAEAYKQVEAQMAFGPRPPGSEALRKTGDYILGELAADHWIAETQEFTHNGLVVRNIIGKTSAGRGPIIIIGAHYDTRWNADQDPVDKTLPVPGANDGASGAAVLLELARTLDKGALRHEVWLVFFDGEDNGGLKGWDWIVGSTYMANNLTARPERMILLDMIGDADQQVYLDGSSNQEFSAELFALAGDLGYGDYFIPEVKYSMHDDHIPFIQRGIPAVDLIDFDYPYWHTAADTLDKVSPASLERAGRLVEAYLERGP